jgi:hypothetical protein
MGIFEAVTATPVNAGDVVYGGKVQTLTSHPANEKHLLKLFGTKGFSGFMLGHFPYSMKVVWDSTMPIRKIREVWHPPDDRFVEYGPEDETWCRWAGIGTIEQVDEGPLYYFVDDYRIFADYKLPVFSPIPQISAMLLSALT